MTLFMIYVSIVDTRSLILRFIVPYPGFKRATELSHGFPNNKERIYRTCLSERKRPEGQIFGVDMAH